eukprot:3938296-Rhodomonas_salina.2
MRGAGEHQLPDPGRAQLPGGAGRDQGDGEGVCEPQVRGREQEQVQEPDAAGVHDAGHPAAVPGGRQGGVHGAGPAGVLLAGEEQHRGRGGEGEPGATARVCGVGGAGRDAAQRADAAHGRCHRRRRGPSRLLRRRPAPVPPMDRPPPLLRHLPGRRQGPRPNCPPHPLLGSRACGGSPKGWTGQRPKGAPHPVSERSRACVVCGSQRRVEGAEVSVSGRSAVVLEGDITLQGKVSVDGALVIKAAPGAKVLVKDLTVAAPPAFLSLSLFALPLGFFFWGGAEERKGQRLARCREGEIWCGAERGGVGQVENEGWEVVGGVGDGTDTYVAMRGYTIEKRATK